MGGNFAIGLGVLAPAGMMNELKAGFGLDAPTVGLLISYGAVVLCLGAPTLAFLTNRWDRRALLVGSLLLYVAGHAASAFAPGFETLLAARLLMISSAAVFTPQAAGTVALFTPEADRPAAITFVFLGWSLSLAVGLPLVTLGASAFGWQAVFAAIAAACAVAAAAVWMTLPRGLRVAPLSVDDWRSVLRTPPILMLISVTALQLAGQFTLFPYLAPELRRTAGASPDQIALALGVYGAAGALGGAFVTRLVKPLGPPKAAFLCLTLIVVGLALYPPLSHDPQLVLASIVVWGLGFASSNALSQARLIAVAPRYASASVALNTSCIYVGQALGTASGGAMIASGADDHLGYVGAALIAVGFALSVTAWRRYDA